MSDGLYWRHLIKIRTPEHEGDAFWRERSRHLGEWELETRFKWWSKRHQNYLVTTTKRYYSTWELAVEAGHLDMERIGDRQANSF